MHKAALVILIVAISSLLFLQASAAPFDDTANTTTLTQKDGKMLKYEKVTAKTFDGHPLVIEMVTQQDSPFEKRPVVLMPGSVAPDKIPFWGEDMPAKGYMLAAFHAERPPDPDPERRPVFLHFDERFANSYAAMGYFAPRDAQVVFDYFQTRSDIAMDKIGWVGSSSTGIPGLAVATQGPRLACVVAFVATGAYAEWLATWKTNHLWKGKTDDLWPETKEYLKKCDPILHVKHMYPTAILMVSGGADKVVDARTAASFLNAARPYYENDYERLRLVVYEGMGHNLPRDIVKMYVEHWFNLYANPTKPSPEPAKLPHDLRESVTRTQITGADHKELTGSK